MNDETLGFSNFDESFPFWIPCEPTSLICLTGVAAIATLLIIILMGVLAYLIVLIGESYRLKSNIPQLMHTNANGQQAGVPSDNKSSDSDTNSDLSDYQLPQISFRHVFAGINGSESQKKVE